LRISESDQLLVVELSRAVTAARHRDFVSPGIWQAGAVCAENW
jgi:hypothetical protein